MELIFHFKRSVFKAVTTFTDMAGNGGEASCAGICNSLVFKVSRCKFKSQLSTVAFADLRTQCHYADNSNTGAIARISWNIAAGIAMRLRRLRDCELRPGWLGWQAVAAGSCHCLNMHNKRTWKVSDFRTDVSPVAHTEGA